MTKWNFADLWEHCAAIRGEQRAQVFGDQVTSWSEFNRRANGVARFMIDAGVARSPATTVAQVNVCTPRRSSHRFQLGSGRPVSLSRNAAIKSAHFTTSPSYISRANASSLLIE